MVGHPGDAPGVSPIRTARIAVFLVPEKMKWNEKWSHGERPARKRIFNRGALTAWRREPQSHPDPRHAETLSYY
jgi:hypothetical protein